MEQEKKDCAGFLGERAQKALALVFVLLAVFLLVQSVSGIKNWAFIGNDIPPQATITVTGKGDIDVKPDIAEFSFGISEESLVVGDAQAKVAKTENNVLSFLEQSGVSKDDIKVSGYNIYPRYEYQTSIGTLYPQPVGKQVLAAYVVSESVDVKVRALGNAGKIIGSMGELGVTNISGLTFSVDKQDEFVKDARSKAIADAQNDAEVLAKSLGVSLVRVISFSENGPNPGPIYYAKAMGVGMTSSDVPSPALPSGTNKISSQVSITYEIR